jgi:hypothetical protein
MPWNNLTAHSAGFAITAAVWTPEITENSNFLELVDSNTVNSDATVTATTVGGADTVMDLGATTYENVLHMIEFFCPRVDVGVAVLNVILVDGSTVLGTISNCASNATITPFYARFPYTPSAGSHTFKIKAWNASAATSNFRAGSGGTAGDSSTKLSMEMFINRVPT